MKNPKRVAIVYPSSNLDSVPSLHNTAILLAEHGYWVDIFTYFENYYISPEFEHKRISVLPACIPAPGKQTRWHFVSSHFRWWLHSYTWRLNLLLRHQQVPYVCVIGVDPRGLLMAKFITRWVKAPLAYYSLELLLSYELTTEEERDLKAREQAFSQQVAFVVIQDQERAALLVRDNDLSPDRIITIPNAPLGPASPRRSNYLRQKFDLSPETKIILHAGSIGGWACTHQLMRSTQDWPDNWVLVCHTRYRATGLNRDYITALQYLAKPGRVIFSTDPVPQHEYPALVQSADVGVVFYCPQPGSTYTQDNIRHIGLSSGKLAYCLWAGLPVVVNDIPSLRRLVTTYRCGEIVDDPSATGVTIERILTDYEAYSRNAATCFNQEFDFAGKFDGVLAALKSLEQR